MFRRLWALALTVVVGTAFVLVGCGGGVSQKVIDDAQARLDQLKSKGVPPEKMTEARVFLDEAKRALEKNNKAPAKKAADSMKVYLEKVENYYKQEVATLGGKIDAARSTGLKAKEELTSFQARKIDSVVAVIDSFKRMDWLLQASARADSLLKMIPFLKEDEAKAARLKKLVPGEWVYTEKAKSVEDPKVNAITTKIFSFGSDGKIHLTEKKFGQSSPTFKEDWLFESWGTYGYKGDTVMLEIKRFAAKKQMFTRMHIIDGKPVWKDEPGPTYDSAITDGSQDRYVTYQDLKDDFKKTR
jgi:polyhydroxyalkanoate synthesis regulator phasin